MNRIVQTLALIGIGAAGVAGGLYLGSQPGPAPTESAAAVVPASPEARPAVGPAAFPVAADPMAEIRALRAELQAVKAGMAGSRAAATPAEAGISKAHQAQRAAAIAGQVAEQEDRFREEPVDPGWSRERSEFLNRVLDGHPELAGGAVECRSSRCRLNLPVGAEAEPQVFELVREAQGQFGQAEIFPPGADGSGATVYFSPGPEPDPDLEPGLQARVTMVTGPSWR